MKVLIHGSGHKADSWNKVITYLNNDKDLLCPNLSEILNGKYKMPNISSLWRKR